MIEKTKNLSDADRKALADFILAIDTKIAFVEDYDKQVARYLMQWVDIWLNNPLPPSEAYETSDMKAVLNGGPQLNVLDGWWVEGFNGKNGWYMQDNLNLKKRGERWDNTI